MKNDAIDVSMIDLSKVSKKPFPPSHRYRIFVARQAHDAIWEHARETEDEKNEVGGVLIGDVHRDEQGPFLEITGAIVGEHTRNEGTQVTFTHETWDQVNKVKDKDYPEARIVGWYHTHPRFGIFLSEMDLFIQKNFFSEPWQTAFVLDPVNKTEGFFIWSKGEPTLIDEYWIEQERRDRTFAKVSHDPDADSESESDEPGSTKKAAYLAAVSRAAFALVVALGFLSLLLVASYVYLREIAHRQVESAITNVVHRQQIALVESLQLMGDLKQRVEKSDEQNKVQDVNVSNEIEAVQQRLRDIGTMTEVVRYQLASQHRVIERLRRDLSAPPTNEQLPGASNRPQ